MGEFIIFWLIIALVAYGFCSGPDDEAKDKPAKGYRQYGCRWPYCTCYQHQ